MQGDEWWMRRMVGCSCIWPKQDDQVFLIAMPCSTWFLRIIFDSWWSPSLWTKQHMVGSHIISPLLNDIIYRIYRCIAAHCPQRDSPNRLKGNFCRWFDVVRNARQQLMEVIWNPEGIGPSQVSCRAVCLEGQALDRHEHHPYGWLHLNSMVGYH